MATVEWTCIGKREAQGGGLATFFMTPEGQEKGYKLKAKSVFRFARPGAVYSVELNDEGRITDARYARQSTDERLHEWIMLSETAEAEVEAVNMAKKLSQSATFRALMDEVKVIYNKQITPAGRRAVLACVMEAIARS
jgi:hypothetical protein